MLKVMGTRAISRPSSTEIERREASLRRSWAISRTIPVEIEGQKRKFKGSRAIPELFSAKTGDRMFC